MWAINANRNFSLMLDNAGTTLFVVSDMREELSCTAQTYLETISGKQAQLGNLKLEKYTLKPATESLLLRGRHLFKVFLNVLVLRDNLSKKNLFLSFPLVTLYDRFDFSLIICFVALYFLISFE